MKTIKVKLKARSYDILVGRGIINSLGIYLKRLKLGEDAFIISNSTIYKRYGNLLSRVLKEAGFGFKFALVPDTEKSKSLKTTYSVIKKVSLFDRKKRVFVIALGGGVIGDLSGFVASVYKRGVPYIQIPTTLLAQVDSSIGGKTGVDLDQGKNLLGAFYQPKLVLSDLDLIRSLKRRQMRSGLAEIIKYSLIKDVRLFDYLEKKYEDLIRCDRKALELVIARCSQIKAKVVGEDEREKRGIRTILNFGHTLGHAIETAGGYHLYNHGEGVSLGMLLACDISLRLKLIRKDKVLKIEELIRKIGLPTKIRKVSIERIIKSHYRDKKFIGIRNKFVLIRDIGKVTIRENIPLKVIKDALKERFSG